MIVPISGIQSDEADTSLDKAPCQQGLLALLVAHEFLLALFIPGPLFALFIAYSLQQLVQVGDLGVQVDQLVGICAERSLEMVVGLLGILKAGAAYLPATVVPAGLGDDGLPIGVQIVGPFLQPGQLEAWTGIRERRWWDSGFTNAEGARRAAAACIDASRKLKLAGVAAGPAPRSDRSCKRE